MILHWSKQAILWAWISAGTSEQKRKKVDSKDVVISGGEKKDVRVT